MGDFRIISKRLLTRIKRFDEKKLKRPEKLYRFQARKNLYSSKELVER